MNIFKSRTSNIVMAAAFAAMTLAPMKSSADDQVVASFDRELAHTPVPTAPVTRPAADEDVLYQALNQVHWSEDLVASSFERAFELEAELGFYAVPAPMDEDALQELVNEPLWSGSCHNDC